MTVHKGARTNEIAEKSYKMKMMELSENKIPAVALDKVWSILSDGNGHSQEELVEAAGYKRPDSAGYKTINKWFNRLRLTEKKCGLIYFTDKVFPEGRP
jgi:hypothetical protein